MTYDEFHFQIRKYGVPGRHILYHRGFLFSDRENDIDVSRIARLVWSISELGYGRLYQKRRGDFDYEYFVVPLVNLRQGGALKEAEALR